MMTKLRPPGLNPTPLLGPKCDKMCEAALAKAAAASDDKRPFLTGILIFKLHVSNPL